MKIGGFDTDERVFIIAEIGNNHEGNFALAEKLVHLAKEAGADAVKFQTFQTEHYVSRKQSERFARLKSFELQHEDFKRLAEIAQTLGLAFISTPFDLHSAEFLGGIATALKIASGDNTFYPLIETAAKQGKPLLISGGMADISELQKAEALVRDTWSGAHIHQDLALLHCVASYPVPVEQANLGAIVHMKNALQCTIGYSDHTIGIEAATIAVALGARIIEKHFTIDHHYSSFRDHQLSADPSEMAELVQRVKNVQAMLGSGVKQPQECEKEMIVQSRRSIVTARDLATGEKIGWDDITWVRPAGGLPPGAEGEVIGKRLRNGLAMGEQLTREVVE